MWFEVVLTGKIFDAVHADVMPEKRNRHDQRHQLPTVILDRGEQLPFRRAVQALLQISSHVLQHVGMPARRRDDRQRSHEGVAIALRQFASIQLAGGSRQPTQFPVSRWRMRHQHQLVRGVEAHERSDSPRTIEQALQARVGKYALDEVFAQPRIR